PRRGSGPRPCRAQRRDCRRRHRGRPLDALVRGASMSTPNAAAAHAPAVHLVQISDTHIREAGRLAYRKVDTAEWLKMTIASVLALRQPPDAVVVTGDLVDFGRPVEYARLRDLLAPLTMPLYVMPGNHDDRERLREAFPEHHWLAPSLRLADGAAPIQYAVRIGPLHLVTLDTVAPGQSHGELCDARL